MARCAAALTHAQRIGPGVGEKTSNFITVVGVLKLLMEAECRGGGSKVDS
jgi:hypothetical protein